MAQTSRTPTNDNHELRQNLLYSLPEVNFYFFMWEKRNQGPKPAVMFPPKKQKGAIKIKIHETRDVQILEI